MYQNKGLLPVLYCNVFGIIRSILWFKVIEFPASLVPATNWGFSIQQYSAFKINIMDSNSLNQQIMNVRMSTIPKNVYLLAAPDSYFGKKMFAETWKYLSHKHLAGWGREPNCFQKTIKSEVRQGQGSMLYCFPPWVHSLFHYRG